jgi:DNA-binding NtrC family response regulator
MVSKFKFEVVPVAEVPKEDKEDSSIFPPRSRPVVLVVDDEQIIADTLSIILSKSGFTTMTAYNGESALKLAHAIQPDLLISDVVMPGMTGVELAIVVSKTIPGCKVLLFSGQAATVDLLQKARHHGHDFTTLTKPIHPTDMLRRISECLHPSELEPERETTLKLIPSSPVHEPQTITRYTN